MNTSPTIGTLNAANLGGTGRFDKNCEIFQAIHNTLLVHGDSDTSR